MEIQILLLALISFLPCSVYSMDQHYHQQQREAAQMRADELRARMQHQQNLAAEQ